MKTRITFVVMALSLSALDAQLSTVRAQGSLTPPGAPAPTMKTLDQIEPRIPIPSLPYTITKPGSYYLTTNLVGTSGANGITVSSGSVVIDLNGFALQGVPGSGTGIAVATTFTNLVFRNGTVTGWGGNGIDGYSSGFPRNLLYEKLTLSANGANGLHTEAGSIIRDCIAIGNGTSGFVSAGGEIIDCVARNNSGDGFTVNFCSLSHCSSEFNLNNGFTLVSSRALDCDSQLNSEGISCSGNGNEVRRCRAILNGDDGIVSNGSGSGTVIEDCEAANNSSHGIETAGIGGAYIAGNNVSLNGAGGIFISDSNNYIENNHVVTTTGVNGILITSGSYVNTVAVRNVVVGGGSPAINYSSAGNDFGPIGSASSATSPWANISH
jgi:hypothetical protein